MLSDSWGCVGRDLLDCLSLDSDLFDHLPFLPACLSIYLVARSGRRSADAPRQGPGRVECSF